MHSETYPMSVLREKHSRRALLPYSHVRSAPRPAPTLSWAIVPRVTYFVAARWAVSLNGTEGEPLICQSFKSTGPCHK